MRCRKCNEEKPSAEFHWKVKGKRRNTLCKECETRYHQEHYQKNKPKILEQVKAQNNAINRRNRLEVLSHLSTHPCVDCGEADPAALDFDHVRGEKSFVIAWALRQSYSWKRILAEIEKCEVRCANCHRKKTAREWGWYSDLVQ